MGVSAKRIVLSLVCSVALGACGEPVTSHDADLGSEDSDIADVMTADAELEDSGRDGDFEHDVDSDFIDAELDSDPEPDDDFDWRALPYCEVADGSHVNSCHECLPTALGARERAALAIVFPFADSIRLVEVEGEEHFVVEADSETLGYAFIELGWGYNGPLTSLTGVTADGMSVRVELVEAHWAEYTDMLTYRWYDRLRCVSLDEVDVETRDWGTHRVDAVTGATDTVNAVLDTVWQAFEHYERIDSP